MLLCRAPDGMVLSLAVPFRGTQVLSNAVVDEVLVGCSNVGFRWAICTGTGCEHARCLLTSWASAVTLLAGPVRCPSGNGKPPY